MYSHITTPMHQQKHRDNFETKKMQTHPERKHSERNNTKHKHMQKTQEPSEKHSETHSENRGASKTHEITNTFRKQGMNCNNIYAHILKTA